MLPTQALAACVSRVASRVITIAFENEVQVSVRQTLGTAVQVRRRRVPSETRFNWRKPPVTTIEFEPESQAAD